jgi:hypothetical protein
VHRLHSCTKSHGVYTCCTAPQLFGCIPAPKVMVFTPVALHAVVWLHSCTKSHGVYTCCTAPQLFGELQKGRSITLSDGRVVTPAEVMNPPSQPGPLLVVIDIPTPQHLEAVITTQPLAKWLGKADSTQGAAGGGDQGSGEPAAVGGGDGGGGAESNGASKSSPPASTHQPGHKGLVLLAHLSPPSMLLSPSYQAWMQGLGPGVSHLLCSLTGQATTLRSATALQVRVWGGCGTGQGRSIC